VAIFLAAGLATSLAATLLLAVLLVRARAARRAADAALAACRDTAADQAARLDLLDRRRAVIAPIESLWRAWTSGRPDEAQLAEAARALAEARLLFAGHLQTEIDETVLLIVAHLRGRSWQRAAIQAGRRDERADLIDQEIAREHQLKPRIAGLRDRLADAARIS
jgi:hypothetical protein